MSKDDNGKFINVSEKTTVVAKCGASEKTMEIEVFIYKIYISSVTDGVEKSTDTGGATNQSASFTVKREPKVGTLTVSYSITTEETKLGTGNRKAVKDKDFTEPGTTSVSFAEGDETKDVTITVKDDEYFEGDEYFGVQLEENESDYKLIKKDEAAGDAGFELVKILDGNKLELQKIVFKDIESLKPDPIAPPPPPPPPATPPPVPAAFVWTAGPHWKKGEKLNVDPAAGYVPVAYAGGKTVQVEAHFKGQIDTDPALEVFSFFETTIGGTDYSSEKTDETKMIKLTNETPVPPATTSDTIKATYTATVALSKKVAHESALSTKFSYHASGGEDKTETATSYLYVTLDTPTTGTQLYHTVVHIGCSAASGETTANKVFEKIWSKFSGADICISKVKIDSGAIADDPAGKLYYYGIDATATAGSPSLHPVPPGEPANTYTVARSLRDEAGTYDLLAYKDGRCGMWASFNKSVARVHGIKYPTYGITVSGSIVEKPGKKYYSWQRLYAGSDTGKHHGEIPREKSWRDHALVYFDQKLYDTSYGNEYGTVVVSNMADIARTAKMFKQYYRREYIDKNGGEEPHDYKYILGSGRWVDGANADEDWITISFTVD
ncbi:MAG: hypothetical protein LBQ66_16365 [Planctomycetaceae bacterium]|nr:hypothetical protein [Planctomycetaceae bacterium]